MKISFFFCVGNDKGFRTRIFDQISTLNGLMKKFVDTDMPILITLLFIHLKEIER
jgi:hypothetical protein